MATALSKEWEIQPIHTAYAYSVTAEAEVLPLHVPQETLKDQVRAIVEREGVEWAFVERLVECESRWDPTADNGADRGLFQINRKWHPDVTDAQALDPVWAAEWAVQRIKGGKSHEWTCANCVSYIRAYYYPKMPKMAELRPNTPKLVVGAVAIFQYKKEKHIAYVSSMGDGKRFEVKECNFVSGKCGTRKVSYQDPFLLGLWLPK